MPIRHRVRRGAGAVQGRQHLCLPRRPRADDILAMKKEEPRLNIYQTQYISNTDAARSSAGAQPAGRSRRSSTSACARPSRCPGTATCHRRVLQRVDKFRNSGLPVDTRWNSALPAALRRLVAGPQGQGLRPQRQVLPAQHRRGEEAAGGRRLRQRPGSNIAHRDRCELGLVTPPAGRHGKLCEPDRHQDQPQARRLRQGLHSQLPRRPRPVRRLGHASGRPAPTTLSPDGPALLLQGAGQLPGFSANGTDDQSGDPRSMATSTAQRPSWTLRSASRSSTNCSVPRQGRVRYPDPAAPAALTSRGRSWATTASTTATTEAPTSAGGSTKHRRQ